MTLRLDKLSLNSGEGYHTDDILPGTSAGQIVYRLCDTLEHRAVSFCAAQSLYQLVTDVSCIQIGEDKYVCPAGNRTSGSLGLCHAGNQSCIQLELSVQCQMRILFLCNLCGFHNLVDKGMLCASLGGMAQHGDDRLRSDQGLKASGRGFCDGSKLFSGGILVQSAVSEKEYIVKKYLSV